jgi:hypothetical protein
MAVVDQMAVLFWVTETLVDECSNVSEERTASIFRVTESGSRQC